ncbi:MAG: hypothetical protein HPY45_17805, partial [Anaerolineae bacterium]|nr:hypothetical protein [Anaerolineae bacterium]
ITPTRLPSRTPAASETPVEPLQEAQYLYDGDNNLVKSVVNGKITYYPGRHYQQNDDTINKYYTLGRQFVAVRTIQDETDTLHWVLDDHLGSTSVTANEDGAWNSEIKYTAYGEVRWKSGLTPTSYRYTAQLEQPYIKLYWYVSRWYDPELGRFTQPDSIVPEPANIITWDRLAYARNNPIRYNDPSGHDVGCVGYDASRCENTYDKLEKQLKKRNYNVTPVVEYIYGEMMRNSRSDLVKELRESNLSKNIPNRISALEKWANMVWPKHAWDHKPIIQQMERSAGRSEEYQHAGTRKYHFDTWSNVHYGYVGSSAGFSREILLDGAGAVQLLVDLSKGKNIQTDPDVKGFRAYDQRQDREAIQIGIELWHQYGDDLQPEDIIWSIEHSSGLEIAK